MLVRHLVAALVVILCLAALVSLGWAAPTRRGAAAEPSRQEATAVREGRGQLKSIDKTRKRLTLELKPEALVLELDRSTTIFVDGRIATLDELEPGMEVRAAWKARRGANRAQWIEVNKRPRPQPLPEAPPGR